MVRINHLHSAIIEVGFFVDYLDLRRDPEDGTKVHYTICGADGECSSGVYRNCAPNFMLTVEGIDSSAVETV